MARWQFVLCVALLAVSAVSGQPQDPNSLEALLGDLNLNDLVNAGQKCDSNKISTAGAACSSAVASTRTPCPPECANLYKEFNDSCGDLFKTLGLNVLLGSCGENIATPSSPSSGAPPPTDGEGNGDYNTDYAQPPSPSGDYTQDDYAGDAPAEAPGTIIPVVTASPTPAPESPSPSPSPLPSPLPSPSPVTAAIAGLPASCDTYFAAIQSQSLESQVACGQALSTNPTECPDVCKTLYSTRPDETCAKDLAAMAANSPPLPPSATNTDTTINNPCVAALTGAGSRSSSVVGVVMAGVAAVATLMVL